MRRRRAELGVVGEAGVVGGEAEQRREPEPLLGGDREPAVMGEHALIATELLGVARGTAEHLRPPGGDVRAVSLVHAVGEEARGEQIVALDAVVEAVHQSPDRRLPGGPFVQARVGLSGSVINRSLS
jgi:hypothetical protein